MVGYILYFGFLGLALFISKKSETNFYVFKVIIYLKICNFIVTFGGFTDCLKKHA